MKHIQRAACLVSAWVRRGAKGGVEIELDEDRCASLNIKQIVAEKISL